jgi:hypothetical protein
MATSGRAHDAVQEGEGGAERRAMLVCRVIAGRVKRAAPAPCQETEESANTAVVEETEDASEEYDSVAGTAGVYSSLDELEVFNPRAILPCFVVVYKA